MLQDHSVVSLAVTSFAVVYAILQLIFPPNSQLPLLVAVFIACNIISRTAFFQRLVRRAALKIDAAAPAVEGNGAFSALAAALQNELVAALHSLRGYRHHARAANDRRRRLFSLMPSRHQKVCAAAGYSAKLASIDTTIDRNHDYLAAIAQTAAKTYGVSDRATTTARNTSLLYPRVVESLGHFARDWSTEGAREVEPLVHYITAQLDRMVPRDQALHTAVVLPGAGLGRVAHEVACHANYDTYAVEFSGLMHACNLHVYADSNPPSCAIHPYVHTCSNFLSGEDQVRPVQVEPRARPQNLHLQLGDFRAFTLPAQYKNVVVVSVFFVDTAENVLEYFDTIDRLTLGPGIRNGYWINVGPLKYGTAAQAELSAAEMARVRKALGWKDLHVWNTIDNNQLQNEYSSLVPNGFLGYMTDVRSMWQGYYGLSMWTSAQKQNKDKVQTV